MPIEVQYQRPSTAGQAGLFAGGYRGASERGNYLTDLLLKLRQQAAAEQQQGFGQQLNLAELGLRAGQQRYAQQLGLADRMRQEQGRRQQLAASLYQGQQDIAARQLQQRQQQQQAVQQDLLRAGLQERQQQQQFQQRQQLMGQEDELERELFEWKLTTQQKMKIGQLQAARANLLAEAREGGTWTEEQIKPALYQIDQRLAGLNQPVRLPRERPPTKPEQLFAQTTYTIPDGPHAGALMGWKPDGTPVALRDPPGAEAAEKQKFKEWNQMVADEIERLRQQQPGPPSRPDDFFGGMMFDAAQAAQAGQPPVDLEQQAIANLERRRRLYEQNVGQPAGAGGPGAASAGPGFLGRLDAMAQVQAGIEQARRLVPHLPGVPLTPTAPPPQEQAMWNQLLMNPATSKDAQIVYGMRYSGMPYKYFMRDPRKMFDAAYERLRRAGHVR